MTEDEAKTKWCPMVRAPSSAIENHNTGINRESADFNCIASACMMWLWVDGLRGARNANGCCGLGGKP
jgi:hypothetical protein